MRKNFTNIGSVVGMVILANLLFIGIAHAQSVPTLPGTITNTSSTFTITDSSYLDITVDSSEVITATISSIPNMVTMDIASSSGTTSTQITISGLTPSTTYYKYQDTYHNLDQFVTDSSGTYTYVQDLIYSHAVFIQPIHSTNFIQNNGTGGDCTSIGSWNSSNQTCTLTTNVTGTIEIDDSNIIIDGAQHALSGASTGSGIYVPNGVNNVTVKDFNIHNFTYAINAQNSSNMTVASNTISSGNTGIMVGGSSVVDKNTMTGMTNGLRALGNNDTITNNQISSTSFVGILAFLSPSGASGLLIASNTISIARTGIEAISLASSTIRDNEISGASSYGMDLGGAHNLTIIENSVHGNGTGLYLQATSSIDSISHNNIYSNSLGIFFQGTSTIEYSSSGEGNFWGHTSTPCFYIFGGVNTPYDSNKTNAVDSHPYCVMNGWVSSTTSGLEPVIIVPGIMGTTLDNASTGDEVWPDVDELYGTGLINGDSYLNALSLNSDGSQTVPLSVGNVISSETADGQTGIFYGNLINSFLASGYSTSTNLFTFPYDWRMDIGSQVSAFNSEVAMVASSSPDGKVNIIAHSLGGLLVKDYLSSVSSTPLIDKLIFAGVPQFGAPVAFKALNYGDDLNFPPFTLSILGFHYLVEPLSSPEIKKISQNMSSIYDLLPSQQYIQNAGSYVEDFASGAPSSLNYAQTSGFILGNDPTSNSTFLADASTTHATLDNYTITVPNFYNIIGCTEPTITGFNEYGDDHYEIKWGLGDGTVPGISTNLSSNGNNYYAINVNHMGLVTDSGIIGLMQEIINDSTSTSSSPGDVSTSSESCTANPFYVFGTHSPITLNVYDSNGDHTGPNASGTIDLQIPGSQYETIGDNSFVIVPESDTYSIMGQALSSGAFTLKIGEYDGSANLTNEATYVDVPLASASTTATLTGISSSTLDPNLSLDVYGNGTDVETVNPTALLNASSAQDIYPPTISVSTSSIPTSVIVGATTTITFSFNDTSSTIATSSATLNGIPFTSGETLTFATTGTSTIQFFAEDNAGNPAFQEYDVTVTATPAISSFSASPSSTSSGASSTLSWNVTNASSVVITPGFFSTSTLVGSIVVNPTSTTVYTLTATSPNGTSTATTTIAVQPGIIYTTSTYATGIAPYTIAFDPHTNTLWTVNSSAGASTVTQINDTTYATSTYSTAGDSVSIAFDSHTNTLWTANRYSRSVTEINDTTFATTTHSGVSDFAFGIAFDPHTNSIWTTNQKGTNVTRIDDTTYGATSYNVGSGPDGIVFDPHTNTLWTANSTGNSVMQINDTTFATTTYAVGSTPYSLAFDPHTNSIWVLNSGDHTMMQMNDTTYVTSTYPVGVNAVGIAFDPHNNSIWVTNSVSSTVTQMNDTTYATTTYAVGSVPMGITFDSNINSMWVANSNNSTVTELTPSE